MAFGNVNSVSAAKSTTKSTPYGTLKGFISPYNSGSSKLCEGGTTIGQNVKSIKIKIEAKKTSTGANIGSTQNQHANSSGVGDTLECWGYAGTKVTFYGTHDAIHTTGYHVYTSCKINSITPPVKTFQVMQNNVNILFCCLILPGILPYPLIAYNTQPVRPPAYLAESIQP